MVWPLIISLGNWYQLTKPTIRSFVQVSSFKQVKFHIITINVICLLYAYMITLLEKKMSLRVDLVETSLHWP